MAYSEPTVEDFLARFPGKFDTYDQYLISFLIDEAILRIGSTWLERDRQPAQLYWVAHMLVTETNSGASGPGAIVSESFGPISRSYANKGKDMGTYDGTEYGRRYRDLLKKNFPGVKIA